MRVSKDQAAGNRERILSAAAKLFREQGLKGVGVDALTQAAGLTHGSLYSHFGSKEGLTAEALSLALDESSERLSSASSLDEYAARYLSRSHRDRPGEGCVMAALAGEIPRQSAAIRQAFTEALRSAMQHVATLEPETPEAEDEALAAIATMVGALALARAVDDRKLSDRLLKAARRRVTCAQP